MTRLLPLLGLALVACDAVEAEDTGEPWLAPEVVLMDGGGVEHALSDHLDSAVLIMLGGFW